MKNQVICAIIAWTLFAVIGCANPAGSNTNGPTPIPVNNGVVTTLAGSLTTPTDLSIDTFGNVYVVNCVNHMIRKITPSGVVSTLAGSGSTGSANGTGIAASFYNPWGIAIDSAGTVYIADTNNHLIRKITPTGVVSTFAGSGSPGSTNNKGIAASFNQPMGIAVDATGNVYVADSGNHLIRKITPAGVVGTFAGSGSRGSTNGTGIAASFYAPMGIDVDSAGNVYVADSSNNLIRKITPTGAVSTLAGSGSIGSTNGTGTAASFNYPWGIAIDSAGTVYIADSNNNLIRKITSTGVVSTLAGSGSVGSTNGTGIAASFRNPCGLAVDAAGAVYVADCNNHLIRKIQ